MNRILILLTALVIAGGCGDPTSMTTTTETERGPHDGRLLEQDDFAVELAIYETGIPPEYRVWLYEDDKPLPPDAATVEVELQRLGGKRERFTFRPEGEYLRGSGVVAEPHSFDVTVRATRDGKPSNGPSIRTRDARRSQSRPLGPWASARRKPGRLRSRSSCRCRA